MVAWRLFILKFFLKQRFFRSIFLAKRSQMQTFVVCTETFEIAENFIGFLLFRYSLVSG